MKAYFVTLDQRSWKWSACELDKLQPGHHRLIGFFAVVTAKSPEEALQAGITLFTASTT